MLIVVGSMVAILALVMIVWSGFRRAKATAQRNACIANLIQLDGHKEQWGNELKKSPSDVPTDADLKGMPISGIYYGRERCPLGGVYTLGRLDQKPTCSIPDHVLPDRARNTQ